MKQNPSTHKKPYTLIAPVEELRGLITTCPRCGGEVELWSQEDETVCVFCNHKVFERQTTNH
ncbi:MAG TPA: hypothetical protein VL197_12020 [Nitrospirota bacterium]|nr:hypothetical protein [Nitrospirota bacterium]